MRRSDALLDANFEHVLAVHVAGLLHELRNYEVVELIALIQLDRLSSLRALVQSDCEEHFKVDTMEFGEHAEVEVRWDTPPKIEVGMVFRNWGVELHYRLMLAAREAGIEIDLLRFSDPLDDAESRVGYLHAALSDARWLAAPSDAGTCDPGSGK